MDGAKQEDPIDPKHALDKVKDDNYVLIDWRTSAAFLMRLDHVETDHCNFHIGSEDFLHENMAMLVADDSPYLDIINAA